jgi:hypothetical protein
VSVESHHPESISGNNVPIPDIRQKHTIRSLNDWSGLSHIRSNMQLLSAPDVKNPRQQRCAGVEVV